MRPRGLRESGHGMTYLTFSNLPALASLLIMALLISPSGIAGDETPLVARNGVWFERDKGFVSHGEFLNSLAKARIVILGEVHDNAEHHRRRAAIVRDLVAMRQASGRSNPPAAVFEHFPADKQATLQALNVQNTARPGTLPVSEFFDRVDWDNSGWPDRRDFAPLFEAVLAAGLTIYAGDVARQTIKTAARKGTGSISATERMRLALDQPLGETLDKASLDEIYEAHCKVMPRQSLATMAFAQRLRDATLADATLTAVQKHGAALLFTGNNHVREDRGVPWYLRARGLESYVTIQFVEVDGEESNPKAVLDRSPGAGAVADYVVFTPKKDRRDPCETLRQRFQNKG